MKKISFLTAAVLCVAMSASAYTGVSDWAKPELEKAEGYSLIPAVLSEADVSKPINRSEFASLSVKLYEAFSGEEIKLPEANPFSDTEDTEILKAYAAGITTGTSETTFEPDLLLSREQAATMLARTYAKSMNTEAKPAGTAEVFADDLDISDWAKESVYFMVENAVINGIGDNRFAPKNTTPEQEAEFYANSTREQSIAISVRMYEKFKTEEEVDLLKKIPVFNFGTTDKTTVGKNDASITLKDITAENYSAYIKEVQRFYPTVTYELPLSGTSGILACTDGEYKITITYNGTEMLISLAQDLGI